MQNIGYALQSTLTEVMTEQSQQITAVDFETLLHQLAHIGTLADSQPLIALFELADSTKSLDTEPTIML